MEETDEELKGKEKYFRLLKRMQLNLETQPCKPSYKLYLKLKYKRGNEKLAYPRKRAIAVVALCRIFEKLSKNMNEEQILKNKTKTTEYSHFKLKENRL